MDLGDFFSLFLFYLLSTAAGDGIYSPAIRMSYLGRRKIHTVADEINFANVKKVLEETLSVHEINRIEIDYLYRYYKGEHPVLNRVKDRNDFINNKIVENRAYEIVKFATGYRVGNPIQYVSRNADKDITPLNDILYERAKSKKDLELVRWQCICGTAYRIIMPEDTLTLITADPRKTYVIYSADITERPLAGVYITGVDEDIYNVYTDKSHFVIKGNVVTEERHTMGFVPIVEYPSDDARLGIFEPVLPLLDAIDTIDSNRIDGIEQFIQSLMVLYGCDIPDGETSSSIKEKGILVLPATDGNNRAEVKILSEQLNQSDTQTVKEDLYRAVLTIVGMPEQSSTSDSSNNGAIMYKQGWQSAEARAQEFERMFDESEMRSLRIMLSFLSRTTDIQLSPSDIQIKFTRRNYEDIVSKATVLVTLLGNEYVARIDAFTTCGLFPDPEEACKRGLEWYNRTPEKIVDEIIEETPVEDEI